MQQVFIQQTKINLQQQKRNESDTNTLDKSKKSGRLASCHVEPAAYYITKKYYSLLFPNILRR